MSEATEFDIGSEVACSDGVGGVLRRVVLDPGACALTHLVVEPRAGRGADRLVPVDHVLCADERIVLDCTTTELAQFDAAQEEQLLPDTTAALGAEQAHVMRWPFYGLHTGPLGTAKRVTPNVLANGARTITREVLPHGEVDVRGGEPVQATDGPIGHIRGILVNGADSQITHVLLDERHLLARKRVAIPVESVKDVEDGVRLSLSRDEVKELPAVR